MGYKLKNKSSARGRFKVTGTGKILSGHAKKRHNAGKLSSRSNRNGKNLCVVSSGDAKIIRRYLKV